MLFIYANTMFRVASHTISYHIISRCVQSKKRMKRFNPFSVNTSKCDLVIGCLGWAERLVMKNNTIINKNKNKNKTNATSNSSKQAQKKTEKQQIIFVKECVVRDGEAVFKYDKYIIHVQCTHTLWHIKEVMYAHGVEIWQSIRNCTNTIEQ